MILESIFASASDEELAQRKLDAPKIIVQEWLEKFYKRKDIHKNEDGSYDVDGNIDLSSMMLEKFPVKFNKISEDFWCNVNNLTTLEGAPSSVGGTFWCHDNKLTDLEGAPRSIGEDFWCYRNKLTSLEGAPNSVGGDFTCTHTKLTSLEGAPTSVGGTFSCSRNNLTDLEGAPKSVGGKFYCDHNKKKFTEEEVRAVCNVEGDIHVV